MRFGYEVPGMVLLQAMYKAQRCCHCWKNFWNSSYGTDFSVVVTLFFFFRCL